MSTYSAVAKQAVDAWLIGKTLKALLVDSTYAQSQDHFNRSDVTGEVSGTNYTAGGIVVTNVTTDLVDGEVNIHMDDIVFTNVTITEAAGIVLYYSSGSAATDTLIAADTFEPEGLAAQTFTYQIPAEGLITFRSL